MTSILDIFDEDSQFEIEECPSCKLVIAHEGEPKYRCIPHQLAPTKSSALDSSVACCHVGEYIIDAEGRVIVPVQTPNCRVVDVFPDKDDGHISGGREYQI